jgi:hypothetical protein
MQYIPYNLMDDCFCHEPLCVSERNLIKGSFIPYHASLAESHGEIFFEMIMKYKDVSSILVSPFVFDAKNMIESLVRYMKK